MTLPIDKLKSVKTIVAHANCADGIMSAVFLHDVLPDAQIHFVQYGTPELAALQPSEGMLFCDFSPPPDRYEDFIEAGTIILDHHKSAQHIVEAAKELGRFGDEEKDPGVCGAYLAYREVWKVLTTADDNDERWQAKNLAHLSGVRDTWQRQSPDWEDACALAEVIRFYPTASWMERSEPFSRANFNWWAERRVLGKLLIEKTQKSVSEAVAKAYRFTSNAGTRVALFPGIKLSSDAADHVGDEADIVVGFDYVGIEEELGTLVFSTRSRGDFNVAALCKANGGGGHTKAAGFGLKFHPFRDYGKNPYLTFREILDAYESGSRT